MQVAMGYVLIVLGVLMEILAVMAWLGIIKPAAMSKRKGATMWDVMLAFVKKAPWIVVVGLVLILCGLRMIGIGILP